MIFLTLHFKVLEKDASYKFRFQFIHVALFLGSTLILDWGFLVKRFYPKRGNEEREIPVGYTSKFYQNPWNRKIFLKESIEPIQFSRCQNISTPTSLSSMSKFDTRSQSFKNLLRANRQLKKQVHISKKLDYQ